METQCLYRAEMKIVDCVKLKKRKYLRKSGVGRKRKEDEGEETRRKQREKDRGVTVFSWLARPYTSAQVDHYGLLVRAHPALAHPASSAAINLRFPTYILTPIHTNINKRL